MKPQGPGSPLESHATVGPDQIQPIRKGSVGPGDLVVDLVDHHGHADLQPQRTGGRHLDPLVGGGRVVDDDVFVAVGRDDPPLFGVGLADVDDEELDSVAPGLPKLMKGTQLVPERRSSV